MSERVILNPMPGALFGVECVPADGGPVERSVWGTDNPEVAELAAGALQVSDPDHLFQASTNRPAPLDIEK